MIFVRKLLTYLASWRFGSLRKLKIVKNECWQLFCILIFFTQYIRPINWEWECRLSSQRRCPIKLSASQWGWFCPFFCGQTNGFEYDSAIVQLSRCISCYNMVLGGNICSVELKWTESGAGETFIRFPRLWFQVVPCQTWRRSFPKIPHQLTFATFVGNIKG